LTVTQDPRTVVVGFNGSDHARRAALGAAEIAGPGGRLIVVIVTEPSQAVGARIQDIEPQKRAHADDLVSEAQALLRSTCATMETEGRIGDPAEQILSASKERAADLIAVGRGGHRPLVPLHKSVTDRVVREASVPVVVVP